MRAIDADKVIEDLQHYTPSIMYSETYNDMIEGIISFINHTPTLDVKSVVHAHWITGTFADITCSNCKFSLCVPYSVIPKFTYCPHCGARMGEDGRILKYADMDTMMPAT